MNRVKRGFEQVRADKKKHTFDVMLPVRGTSKSAGYDFFLPIDVEIEPQKSILVWTDIKAYMQDDEVLKGFIRSSMAIKKGLSLKNLTAIIDSDYCDNPDNDGNIGICIQNNTNEVVNLKKGERISQFIFEKYLLADTDNAKGNRDSGIGSTGV